MKVPFDLNAVIRKAKLRDEGAAAVPSLALAMQKQGMVVKLMKRRALVGIYGSIVPNAKLMRGDDVFMIRTNGAMFNLDFDRGWQKALERVHLRGYKRGDKQEAVFSTLTVVSRYIDTEEIVQASDIDELANKSLVRTLRGLIKQNLGETRIGPPYDAWNWEGRASNDPTDNTRSETRYLTQEGQGALYKIEANEEFALVGLARHFQKYVDPGIELVARQILLVGNDDNPGLIEAFRCAVRTSNNKKQLCLGGDGEWMGLRENEYPLAGDLRDGAIVYFGPTEVLHTRDFNGRKEPDYSWIKENESAGVVKSELMRMFLEDVAEQTMQNQPVAAKKPKM